jgi:hypothetical protein
MCQLKKREVAFPLPFSSFPVLNRWGDGHHTGEGAPSLHSILIQMLTSSRNTVTDTTRTCVFTRHVGIT